MTALKKLAMDNWRFNAGKSMDKMRDVMLLLWSVLLNLHRRAKTNTNTTVEDGLDVGYEPVTITHGEDTVPISEFQIKCSLLTETSTMVQEIELIQIDKTKSSNETLSETETENPETENEIEASEEEDDSDFNNNRLELDLSFTYNNDDDEIYDNVNEGYEADSDESDVEELSNDDATYRNLGYWSDDDEISYLLPKRPIRIRPIERMMPVGNGLRVSVLKQEARKALPPYFRTSLI